MTTERKATRQLTCEDVEKAGQEGNALFEEWVSANNPEDRNKRELPEWLKKISDMPACKYCGVIAGSCLVEALGGKCKRDEEDSLDD